jgi:hypothetical protein
MEIPLEEGAAARVPPRIRRRLLEGRAGGGGGGGQTSAEEIEARLKEAEQRRQVGVSVSLVFLCLLLCFSPFFLLTADCANCELEAVLRPSFLIWRRWKDSSSRNKI